MEAAFLIGIKLSIWPPKFTDSSHSSPVYLVSEHMENEKIPQEARGRSGKLRHEGNAGQREVVSFEKADESVLEIRRACQKAVIRGIDGCKKGDCSFLEYSYARASDANGSCPVGGESSKMQSCRF